MIEHGVPEESHEVERLQLDIRIIGDHIINSHHSMRQCMDKGIDIQVCLPVIGPHGRIKIDYCIEAENK
jgi:hypothetical protein